MWFGMAGGVMFYNQVCIGGEGGNQRKIHALSGLCQCMELVDGKELLPMSLVALRYSAENGDSSHLWMVLYALWYTGRCLIFVNACCGELGNVESQHSHTHNS
jgi:hypothetical protein